VERLAAQAQMHGSNLLLTTEKDAMNLPDSAAAVLERAGVELRWLKIGVHVEKEEQLLALIGSLSLKSSFTRREMPRSV
jgi:tetraacyldisaccharide-1-P 4'-kinase